MIIMIMMIMMIMMIGWWFTSDHFAMVNPGVAM